MLRRKSIKAVVCPPDNFTNRQFEEVVLVTESVPVYDSKGNVVERVDKTIIVRKPIDRNILEHRGEKCELYSIENQINAGVNLKDFSGAFLTPDLSESSYLGEQAIAQLESKINVESSKQE